MVLGFRLLAFAKGELRFHGRFAPLNQPREFKAFARTLYAASRFSKLRPTHLDNRLGHPRSAGNWQIVAFACRVHG